jgi:hypothetical protein
MKLGSKRDTILKVGYHTTTITDATFQKFLQFVKLGNKTPTISEDRYTQH